MSLEIVLGKRDRLNHSCKQESQKLSRFTRARNLIQRMIHLNEDKPHATSPTTFDFGSHGMHEAPVKTAVAFW